MACTPDRRLVVLLWIGCALLSARASVRHVPHRLEVAQIEQLEGAWREAQLTGDVPAMDRLLSEDFLGITATGSVVTKAQQLERMRSRKFVIRQMDIADTRIKLVGALAIVTSLAAIDGEADTQTMHGRFRYTRIYKRLPNGSWKLTSFEATRLPPSPAFAATQGRLATIPAP